MHINDANHYVINFDQPVTVPSNLIGLFQDQTTGEIIKLIPSKQIIYMLEFKRSDLNNHTYQLMGFQDEKQSNFILMWKRTWVQIGFDIQAKLVN